MNKTTILFAAVSMIAANAAEPKLEVFLLEKPHAYRSVYSNPALKDMRETIGAVELTVAAKPAGSLTEYAFEVTNRGKDIALLKFQLTAPSPVKSLFWDGFEYFRDVEKTVAPKHDLHNFPGAAALSGTELRYLGIAPWTLSSRFERAFDVTDGTAKLRFEHYTAVKPGETIRFGLVSGSWSDARRIVEAIEEVHKAYPDFFRPIPGADERIYGAGGYTFSCNETRLQQLESTRREGFSWEWYYNCYQIAGDVFPSEEHWNVAKGYKTEISHNACNVPNKTVVDWLKYNQDRVRNAQRTFAPFYYYLQQHCNEKLLAEKYPDSEWVCKDRKSCYRAHGWAEEGWSRYAWCGQYGSYGKALRADLAEIWKNLDVSGFALDCAVGNLRCYDEPALNEPARAFEDDGDIFVREGVELAYNLQYTRSLPPRANGRRAASILNESYNYMPVFYVDAAIHEMPPFERTEVLAPRKFMLGQKPFYFWKGFRIDSLLDWSQGKEKVLPELNGIIDYIIMASLRFGAVPAIFFDRGYADIARWNKTFAELQKLGWRAAPYAEVVGTDEIDPFDAKAKYWISRFGDGENSVIVISCPDKTRHKVTLEIRTGKFGAGNAIYAATDGRVFSNRIGEGRTLVEIELFDHHPLILKKIGTDTAVNKPYIAFIRGGRGKDEVHYWKNRIIGKVPPPVKYDPMTIYKLDFGVQKLKCAVVAAPGEGEKVDPGRDQLMVYFEYFRTRRRFSYPRLWGLEKRWVKDMRMRLLTPDEADAAPETLLLALGPTARERYFPGRKAEDEIVIGDVNGKKVVAFYPGKHTENEIVQVFLSQMDRRFPHYGGISDGWAQKIKLYGGCIDNDRTPERIRLEMRKLLQQK